VAPHIRNVLLLDSQLNVGGREKRMLEFARRIDRSRFELKVCCLKPGSYFKQHFIEAGSVFYDGVMKNKYDLFAYREFERILTAEQIDLIYTYPHWNTLVYAMMAKFTGRVARVIVAFHGAESGDPKIHPFKRALLGRADLHLAVGEDLKRLLVDSGGLDGRRIRIIHNGTDCDKFRPVPGDPAIRQALGIKEDARVIVTVASLKPIKNISLLIEATAEVCRSRPGPGGTHLLIVGDGPLRGEIEDQARRTGIGDHVTFVGIRDDVEELLRIGDVFALPSLSEASPNSVLEAMATGLPVVVTDVGCLREMVRDGQNGAVVPSGDARAMAAALRRYLDDADLAGRAGERGREIVLDGFSLETMCAERERTFAEVIGGDA
jgi:glycosyltransferase involved in cell wall biosynthesis